MHVRCPHSCTKLTDVQPAEYRADLVILLLDGVPVYGIVIEAQLTPDERKRFVWPVYAVNLRARLELPVCTLVVTVDDDTLLGCEAGGSWRRQ